MTSTSAKEAIAADRFLRLAEVIDLAGLGKSMIYRKVRDGSFPAPYKPGGSSTRWSEQEVRDWQDRVRQARRTQT